MTLHVVPRRPWLKLGRHVYLPCADPDGRCLKLNPRASQIWVRWIDSAGSVDSDAERRLAEHLSTRDVVALEPVEGSPGR